MNQDQRELLTITRAAVERLREEAWELRRVDKQREQAMLALHREAREYKQRIAALEEAARRARDTLQYKPYKLNIVAAIAKLDAVLGNA